MQALDNRRRHPGADWRISQIDARSVSEPRSICDTWETIFEPLVQNFADSLLRKGNASCHGTSHSIGMKRGFEVPLRGRTLSLFGNIVSGVFTTVLAKTLEVVLAHRLHFGRGRPNAAELRTDAKAGGSMANK